MSSFTSTPSFTSSPSLLKILTGFILLFNNGNNGSSTLSLEDCISALTMDIIISFLISKEQIKQSGIAISIESATKMAKTNKIVSEFIDAAKKEAEEAAKNSETGGDAMYKIAMEKQQSIVKWIQSNKLYMHSIRENTKFLKKIFDNKKLSKFLSIRDNILFIGEHKFTEVNFMFTAEYELKLYKKLIQINF